MGVATAYITGPCIHTKMPLTTDSLNPELIINKNVIVAIPCYNEEIAVGSVVLNCLKYTNNVVVIDDGSKDRTADIARRAGAEVIVHKKNMGKGTAIKNAFHYASLNDADILVLIDGDGQHNPDEIPLLIEPIIRDNADIVNGSRFLNGKNNNVPKYRRIGQEILTMATNLGTNKWVTDTQNGFRAFSSKTFKAFSFNQNGMGIESEMLMDAARNDLKIVEVPINVRYDIEGSTYNPVQHGINVFNSIIFLIMERRPIAFFSILGIVSILMGSIFYILDAFNSTNSGIVLSTIFALFTITGIFCLFIGLMSWLFKNFKAKVERKIETFT